MEKVNSLYKEMRELFSKAKLLIRQAESVGATWAVEWPKNCRYWKDKWVAQFMSKRSTYDAFVDGCMVGLVAQRAPHQGRLMRKPWRIVTKRSQFAEHLTVTCTHARSDHVAVEGSDAKLTENYSEAFVDRVLDSWAAC